MSTLPIIRATGNDEMCNFYIMFYTDASVQNPAGECGGVQLQNLVDNMPADSDVTLPPNPLLDERAHGHGHHHHSSMTHTQYVAAGSPTAPGSSAAPTGTAGFVDLVLDVGLFFMLDAIIIIIIHHDHRPYLDCHHCCHNCYCSTLYRTCSEGRAHRLHHHLHHHQFPQMLSLTPSSVGLTPVMAGTCIVNIIFITKRVETNLQGTCQVGSHHQLFRVRRDGSTHPSLKILKADSL